MEIHRITSDGITKYVLIDDTMRLVQPVNRYLEYMRLRGRAERTIKSYGYDLKAYFKEGACLKAAVMFWRIYDEGRRKKIFAYMRSVWQNGGADSNGGTCERLGLSA